MKNLFNISATLVVALILFSFGVKSEVVGACPPGSSTQNVLLEVGDGCIFSAVVCYYCSVLGNGATKVELITDPVLESPGCIPSVAYEDVIAEFLAVLQNPNFVFNELCPTTSIPPCTGSGTPKLVTYKLPQCWQAQVIMYYGERHIQYKRCSDDVCEVTYEVCKNIHGVYEKTMVGTPIGGVPGCTVEARDVTNFPDAFDLSNYPLYTPTECYIYPTPCSP